MSAGALSGYGYRLTERRGAKVERRRFEALDGALERLEERGRALGGRETVQAVDLGVRRFEPVQRVVARLELAGPRRLRAGLDVRGDGSVEGYVGCLRRRVVLQREGESPYDALRRELEP